MRRFNPKIWSSLFLLTCGLGPLQSQTVEHVVFYRDAAVVTWMSDCEQVPCTLALSDQPLDDARYWVIPSDASKPIHVSAQSGRMAQNPSQQKRSGDLRVELEGIKLDLSLKSAQLDLVEEDLAMLRANRKVGGTAESVLVEDLEEVSDWMHTMFREALYRRVELRGELTLLEEEKKGILEELATLNGRDVHQLTADVSDGTGLTLWTEVLESSEAGWKPKDQLNLAQGGQKATWSQRVGYTLNVPATAETKATFVDRPWSPRKLNADVAIDPKVYGKVSRAEEPHEGAVVWSSEQSSQRFEVPSGFSLAGPIQGEVEVASHEVSVVRSFSCTPKTASVVEAWVTFPLLHRSAVASREIQVLDNGKTPSMRPLLVRADSIQVSCGVDDEWSVSRSKEMALCSKSPLGNRIKHKRAFVIEISNQSKEKGVLTVREPLPTARNLEIEMSPEDLDGGVLNEALESIVWHIELNAGERRTLSFSFDVIHDKGVSFSE